MEKLFKKGAKDVFFTPIYMKKNRPATKLTVLTSEKLIKEMEYVIFSNLSTIGIRKYVCERSILKREEVVLDTSFGECKFKVCTFEDNIFIYPEYESAKEIANELNLGFDTLFAELKLQGNKFFAPKVN